MFLNQTICMTPLFVFPFSKFEVTVGNVVECASAARCALDCLGIGALGNLKHDAARQLARVGDANLCYGIDVVVALATAELVDRLPSLVAGWLDAHREPCLFCVPAQVGRGAGFQIFDVKFAEDYLARRSPHCLLPVSKLTSY
jgi:hypothetical protein